MAERPINWALEIKRLEVEVAQDDLNLRRNEQKLMELEDEASRVRANSAAIDEALPAKMHKLAAMKQEHES